MWDFPAVVGVPVAPGVGWLAIIHAARAPGHVRQDMGLAQCSQSPPASAPAGCANVIGVNRRVAGCPQGSPCSTGGAN